MSGIIILAVLFFIALLGAFSITAMCVRGIEALEYKDWSDYVIALGLGFMIGVVWFWFIVASLVNFQNV